MPDAIICCHCINRYRSRAGRTAVGVNDDWSISLVNSLVDTAVFFFSVETDTYAKSVFFLVKSLKSFPPSLISFLKIEHFGLDEGQISLCWFEKLSSEVEI